jgi:hypothetical protein
LNAIVLQSLAGVAFAPGDTLTFELLVRVAASSSHPSGTARLWYNDAQANSQIAAPPCDPPIPSGYLRAGPGLTIGSSPGVGPRQSIDVTVNRANGNPWKRFGIWTAAQP